MPAVVGVTVREGTEDSWEAGAQLRTKAFWKTNAEWVSLMKTKRKRGNWGMTGQSPNSEVILFVQLGKTEMKSGYLCARREREHSWYRRQGQGTALSIAILAAMYKALDRPHVPYLRVPSQRILEWRYKRSHCSYMQCSCEQNLCQADKFAWHV